MVFLDGFRIGNTLVRTNKKTVRIKNSCTYGLKSYTYKAFNSTISVEFKINQWIYLQVHKLFCFEIGLISLRYLKVVGNMSGILAVL